MPAALSNAPADWLVTLAPDAADTSARVRHVADTYDVSERTVWRWVRSGKLPTAMLARVRKAIPRSTLVDDALRNAYCLAVRMTERPERAQRYAEQIITTLQPLVGKSFRVSARQRRFVDEQTDARGHVGGDGLATIGPTPLGAIFWAEMKSIVGEGTPGRTYPDQRQAMIPEPILSTLVRPVSAELRARVKRRDGEPARPTGEK